MKNLLETFAYVVNGMVLLLIFVIIVGVILWGSIVLPNWLILIIVVGLPVAHLLDKYWWRNTETYYKAMNKLLGKNNRHLK